MYRKCWGLNQLRANLVDVFFEEGDVVECDICQSTSRADRPRVLGFIAKLIKCCHDTGEGLVIFNLTVGNIKG